MPLPDILKERQLMTPELQRRLRTLLAMGHTQRQVANRLNLSLATVWKYSKDDNIKAANDRTRRWHEAQRLTPEEKARRRREAEARRLTHQPPKIEKPIDRTKTVPVGRNEIRTSIPIVRELFLHIWRKNLLIKDVAAKAKIPSQTLSLWRKGHGAPTLNLFMDVARIVGFEVQLVAIKQENPDGMQTD